ncbi:hypothetical protein BC936DRAFT_148723 [Jimgerdemannia flammicorona]|uniref:Uncharacterized protein n=1 Tax=Jimgerdemannia flammicorona TaxID=994334 RepID=A0A433DKB0_9FUNG|nr:hypothetical protein BC936DRAFT_148723 [Jimgerdemannia flammicorona]
MKRSIETVAGTENTEDAIASTSKKRARAQKTKVPAASTTAEPMPRGQVRVDRLPPRFAKNVSKKWPVVEGYKNVNVCSSGAGFWKELSPMLLGPIALCEWGIDPKTDLGKVRRGVEVPGQCKRMENLWQFSKVFEEEVGEDLWPSVEFFRRRATAWKDPKGHRHSVKGARVKYFLWGQEKLTFLEARKRIYCSVYASIVKKTKAYRELERLLNEGQNVQILGYDGYDRGNKTWEECLNDLSRPFGHEMVLAALLDGVTPWEDGSQDVENVE